MKQKKTIGSSIGLLIGVVIAILAFVRGIWQLPLLIGTFALWGLWLLWTQAAVVSAAVSSVVSAASSDDPPSVEAVSSVFVSLSCAWSVFPALSEPPDPHPANKEAAVIPAVNNASSFVDFFLIFFLLSILFLRCFSPLLVCILQKKMSILYRQK